MIKANKSMLTIDKFYNARIVLDNILRKTDLVHTKKVNTTCEVYLKPECLQRTGSFKIRGAYYKMSQLSNEEKAKGVVACSAGNHAQGVALGATSMGIKSLICLPEAAPMSKVEATRQLGAEICLVPGVYDDAYNRALAMRDEFGYTFIHPFNDENVIAGQGTIALEILEELPDVDVIVVPIGGGGLISGVAYAAKTLNPNIKIYGVQAENAASMVRSLEAKKPVLLNSVSTLADGIAVKQPGDITFDICSNYVDGVVTVSEEEICAAILRLIEKKKMVAEGAGAVAVAAVMFDKIPVEGKKVVCLVSGGNIDVTTLGRVISSGLIASGRLCSIHVEVNDQPGTLAQTCTIVSKLGANIISVHHDRTMSKGNVRACVVKLTAETRNEEHLLEIKSTLKKKGFNVVND